MRKLLFLGLSVIYMLIMTFCEYTPDVTNHITDVNNYVRIDATVVSAEYHETGYSYIYVTLNDFSHYEGFFGFAPPDHSDSTLKGSVLELRIVTANAQLLRENGFFDEVREGDIVSLITTCWVNNGLPHNYPGYVAVGETVYLGFEDGFDNICDSALSLKELDYDDIFKKQS